MSVIAEVKGIIVQEAWVEGHQCVYWTSGAEIDADGANGQNGKPFAYRFPEDNGLDRLADAEYPHGGWRDILIDNGSGKPLTDGNGNAYSQTTYFWRGAPVHLRFVDAATVPYIVVNPHVRRNAVGTIMGCKATATYRGKTIDAVVADVSGPGDIGEISIAAAELLGIPSNARAGGVDSGVSYQLFPSVHAVVNNVTYTLLEA